MIAALCISLSACDSTNTGENTGGAFQFGIAPTVSLDGGSRWFALGDTGIYYDAALNFLVRNGTAIDREIYYTITFGLQTNNGLTTDSSVLASFNGIRFVSDTIELPKNGSVNISDTLFIDLCRRVYQDWRMPYGYRLTIYSVGTSDSLTNEGNCAGSVESNRFRGVTLTDSKGVVVGSADGPDDGDYMSFDTTDIKVLPFYPNPATHTAIALYTSQKKRKATLYYFYTRRVSVFEAALTVFLSGTNNFYAADIPTGQIRLGLIFLDESGKQDTVYGDLLK